MRAESPQPESRKYRPAQSEVLRQLRSVRIQNYKKGPSAEAESPSGFSYCRGLAAEELEDGLRSGVGLGQDRLTSLLEDIRLGEVHHFRRHIHVADAALGCRQVLLADPKVRNRVLQTVLIGTEAASVRGNIGDCLVDRGDQATDGGGIRGATNRSREQPRNER